MNLQPFLLFLHLASVVLWVGGMFFAYVCLRPTAVQLFEPPQRLRLWRGVFQRFFVWVWGAVVLIPASGLVMLGKAGFAGAPLSWHLMLASGLVMIGIFIYVATGPYAALNRIRQFVGTNLLLGFLTIAIATLGRWFA